jgi:metallo-beta-lactamase family protein
MGNFTSPPKKIFITHGEKETAHHFKDKIEQRFGWTAFVPTYGHTENI